MLRYSIYRVGTQSDLEQIAAAAACYRSLVEKERHWRWPLIGSDERLGHTDRVNAPAIFPADEYQYLLISMQFNNPAADVVEEQFAANLWYRMIHSGTTMGTALALSWYTEGILSDENNQVIHREQFDTSEFWIGPVARSLYAIVCIGNGYFLYGENRTLVSEQLEPLLTIFDQGIRERLPADELLRKADRVLLEAHAPFTSAEEYLPDLNRYLDWYERWRTGR